MLKRISTLIFIIIFQYVSVLQASQKVKVVSVKGEISVRWGIEETWNPATKGMVLRPEDSIKTGKNGMVVLELPNGKTLTMFSEAVIDIVDLKETTERDFFLFLMSEKVNKLEDPKKIKLEVGDVTVIHGSDKSAKAKQNAKDNKQWRFEVNGALILKNEDYGMNAIMKLMKIVQKYAPNDGGEINYHIGSIFEKLGYKGQAEDAYKVVLDNNPDKEWKQKTEFALQQIKQK